MIKAERSVKNDCLLARIKNFFVIILLYIRKIIIILNLNSTFQHKNSLIEIVR